MTEIYLIRHAQAEGNIFRMMQGHWDGGVTSLGRKQIELLSRRFKDIHIDAVYSSDLYRTRLTASAITRSHPVPFILRKDLREINVGPWEARYFGDVMRESPEMARKFVFDPENWYVEGAESYKQVAERVSAALTEIAEKHPGESVAAVSHGVSIRCALSKLLNIPLNDLERLPICGNTAVTKLSYDSGGFHMEYFNDLSHLESLGQSPWARTAALRSESFEPEKEGDWYLSCYEDAWRQAHGSSEGFSNIYLRSAENHYLQDKEALLRFYDGDEPAGLLDMDTLKGQHAGYGWISFIYLLPAYRGRGCGVQLLARAIFKYRALGRRSIRLHVAEENSAAISFYNKMGFRELSRENGRFGQIILMEKKLEEPQDEK